MQSDKPGCKAAASQQILFVDDDRRALDSFTRMLHREFDVETAQSGAQGLAAIHLLGPFALVISDMRMPAMNGAEFLAQVRQLAPNTVRMLLTGYQDLRQAIDAVNDGHIFRYLSKPCDKEEMVAAIRLGLAEYKARMEEKDLADEAREMRMELAARIPPPAAP